MLPKKEPKVPLSLQCYLYNPPGLSIHLDRPHPTHSIRMIRCPPKKPKKKEKSPSLPLSYTSPQLPIGPVVAAMREPVPADPAAPAPAPAPMSQ